MKVNNDEKCAFSCTQFLNQYHSEILASLSGNSISEDDLENQKTDGDSRPIISDLHQVESMLLQIEQNFE